MEHKDIKEYINKLKALDEKLNPNNISDNFVVELNNVLNSLNKDIETELGRKVQSVPLMDVNFKKLHPDAVTPTYAKEGDAGLDLTAINIISNDLFQITYGTGIAFEIPIGYLGFVFSRSSVRDYTLHSANCVGVIDSGFRGEIEFTFNKIEREETIEYNIGDRIGQIVIIPFPKIKLTEKKELSKSERNDGSYGHTGK